MHTHRADLAIAATLALTVIAVWAPALGASFQFDDWAVIVDDPRVQSLEAWWASMPGMRALTKASWALDHELGGSVETFRRTSVALHAANAVLVYGVLRSVATTARRQADHAEGRAADAASRRGSRAAAAVGALVFALHPVQTESVTYLAARSGQWAALGSLIALLAWQRQFASTRPGGLAALALLALTAALGGKETAAVAPLAMALLAATAPGPFTKTHLRALVAPVLLVVTMLGLGLLYLPYGHLLQTSLTVRTPLENLLAQVGALGELGSHLVLWHRLNADPGAPATATFGTATGAGLAVLATGLLSGLVLLRRSPAIAFGLLWTFVWLAPTNSLLARLDLYNDRQWYLAIAGPGWLLGLALARLPLRPRAWAVAVLAAALAAGTVTRNRVYETEVTFWTDVLAKSPGNARAANNLGIAHARACQPQAAAAAFRRAIDLAPGQSTPAVNLALLEQGELSALPAGCHQPLGQTPPR